MNKAATQQKTLKGARSTFSDLRFGMLRRVVMSMIHVPKIQSDETLMATLEKGKDTTMPANPMR